MRLVIEGVPGTKQSARFMNKNNKIVSYQSKKVNDYKHKAQMFIFSQLPKNFSMITEPVSISYRFLFHYTSDIAKKFRTGRLFKYKKPDIDNLQKAINDVLNDFVIKDDALIVHAEVTKEYSDKSQTIIEIKKIGDKLWK
jgi:Holliday junction resolvase RusA-like endonuclease